MSRIFGKEPVSIMAKRTKAASSTVRHRPTGEFLINRRQGDRDRHGAGHLWRLQAF